MNALCLCGKDRADVVGMVENFRDSDDWLSPTSRAFLCTLQPVLGFRFAPPQALCFRPQRARDSLQTVQSSCLCAILSLPSLAEINQSITGSCNRSLLKLSQY